MEAFATKLRYFTDLNGSKTEKMKVKMNFDYFQIQKCILQTENPNLAENVDQMMG